MWWTLRRMLFRPPQTLLGLAWVAEALLPTVLFEKEWVKATTRDKVRKNLKLWHFMGWTASRILLTVCWKASLAVFALDTTSHWVLVGTVSHVPPCSGKHGFIAAVLRSWQGGWPLGKMGRWHKGGGVEAFPSKGVRKVFLKCFFPLGHPSLVLGGALLWPQKKGRAGVLMCLCCCGYRALFLCLLCKFYPHLAMP